MENVEDYYLEVKEYLTIAWAEMKPDVYGGNNFDEHIPLWNAYWEGDMDDDTFSEDIKLSPKDFPPGTKITIQIPVCPKCHEDYELCMSNNNCDFDWKYWTECKYS